MNAAPVVAIGKKFTCLFTCLLYRFWVNFGSFSGFHYKETREKQNPVKPVISRLHGVFTFGAPGGIRTPDLLIRSQTLYPTELRAQDMLFSYSTLVVLTLFIKMVAPAGIEPATQGFSVPCSTD